MLEAQRRLSAANAGGATGVFLSGLFWFSAGVVECLHFGTNPAFAVLFVGGMLITPLAALLNRHMFRLPSAELANPLNRLGLEAASSCLRASSSPSRSSTLRRVWPFRLWRCASVPAISSSERSMQSPYIGCLAPRSR